MRRKLLSVIFLAVLACVPPVSLVIATHGHLAEERDITRANRRLVADLDRLQDTLMSADTAARFYAILAFDDPQSAADFAAAAGEVPAQLARLEASMPPNLDDQLALVEASSEQQLAELGALVGYSPLIPPSEDPSDDRVATEREPSLLDKLLTSTEAVEAARVDTEALEARLDERLVAGRERLDALEMRLLWATLTSLVVALLAIAGGTIVVTTGIASRLERLSDNARRFLGGEPLIPMRESKDEIGQLTNDLEVVAELLEHRRGEVEASRDAALAATRAKDEFLSRISHELRTPLTAIIGFGQLLEDEDLSPDDTDSVHHIVKAGHHLLALINELLDIAKIEAGHLTISLEPVSVDEVADEVGALVRGLAASRSITVTMDCPDEILVAADRQRLKQVLLNLLTNGIKYNRQSGRVDVAATPRGDVVRISVADTGAGISPAGVELLFRPFERLGAEDSDIDGSGIGLALTKSLVEAMGGTIGVDTTEGQGSTFWVDLARSDVAAEPATLDRRPAVPAAARASSPPRPDAPGGAEWLAPGQDRPVVLYIEDSMVNVRLMERLFRGRPERLEAVSQGRAGLVLARELRPQLVLLDLDLPDLNGSEVLGMLKADPTTAGTPVVILSADATPHRAKRMLAQGAAAYLSKPIDVARLVEVLETVPQPASGPAR